MARRPRGRALRTVRARCAALPCTARPPTRTGHLSTLIKCLPGQGRGAYADVHEEHTRRHLVPVLSWALRQEERLRPCPCAPWGLFVRKRECCVSYSEALVMALLAQAGPRSNANRPPLGSCWPSGLGGHGRGSPPGRIKPAAKAPRGVSKAHTSQDCRREDGAKMQRTHTPTHAAAGSSGSRGRGLVPCVQGGAEAEGACEQREKPGEEEKTWLPCAKQSPAWGRCAGREARPRRMRSRQNDCTHVWVPSPGAAAATRGGASRCRPLSPPRPRPAVRLPRRPPLRPV
jgi:hypothetical protein